MEPENTPDHNGPEHKPSEAAKPDKSTSDPDRSADRRDARSRKRRYERRFRELGINETLGQEVAEDLAPLLPPQHRMSNADDVRERLTSLDERDAKAKPKLLMGETGVNLDVTSTTAARQNDRKDNKLDDLIKSDEGVLRAYVANERLRADAALRLAEHDALRGVLVAELARRYTLAEQWRYQIPKFMLPVFAVLEMAAVRRNDLRLGRGTTLLDKIIQVVAQHQHDKGITEASLKDVAKNAEFQFEDIRSADSAGQQDPAKPPPSSHPSEPIEIRPPADEKQRLLFSPRWLSRWPEQDRELAEILPQLPRAQGIGRSVGHDPWGNWELTTSRAPFCFPAIRRQKVLPPISDDEPIVDEAELLRWEIGLGRWCASVVPGYSDILGPGDRYMWPRISFAAPWDGDFDQKIFDAVQQFGNPRRPETVHAGGNIEQLQLTIRSILEEQCRGLRFSDPHKFLFKKDEQGNQPLIERATEHLTRWWIFLLLARHNQPAFDAVLPDDYFQGVHAPDIVMLDDGRLSYGSDDASAHIVIHRRGELAQAKMSPGAGL